MDKKSMGTFLTDLRKEKGLTQQEVADNLNVSNKTISKWERDEGYPEITMLPEIAKFYGITTDELLNGEKTSGKIEDDVNEIGCIANNERFSGLIYGLRILGVMSPVMIAILSVIINFLDFGFGRTLAHYVIYSATVFTIVGAIIATSFSLFELKNLQPIEYTVDFINDEMFSTEEEAISEYNKIKKAVTENFTVFQIYSEKGDELILNEIHITSEKRGESYFISELYGSEEEKRFFTKEEKDEFIKETVVSEVHSDYLYSMDENIVFDDENYCISFNDVDESESFADGVVTFYVITATGILSALYIILFIYYNKKKVRV